MKEIPITRGYVALVDDSDYGNLSQFSWHAQIVPKLGLVYARHDWRKRDDSGCTNGMGKTVHMMHRMILGLSDPRIFVDHIDGNGLNNCRSNLRTCTFSQNMQNRGKKHARTSLFKGVHWGCNSWRVQIFGAYIGSFNTEIEAALAYNLVALISFGDFARINKLHAAKNSTEEG